MTTDLYAIKSSAGYYRPHRAGKFWVPLNRAKIYQKAGAAKTAITYKLQELESLELVRNNALYTEPRVSLDAYLPFRSAKVVVVGTRTEQIK